MTINFKFAALGLVALAAVGCGGTPPPYTTIVTIDAPRPKEPPECTMADPPFPVLPVPADGEYVDEDTAARDREAIRDRDVEIERRRAVCRAWHRNQLKPGSVAVKAANRK